MLLCSNLALKMSSAAPCTTSQQEPTGSWLPQVSLSTASGEQRCSRESANQATIANSTFYDTATIFGGQVVTVLPFCWQGSPVWRSTVWIHCHRYMLQSAFLTWSSICGHSWDWESQFGVTIGVTAEVRTGHHFWQMRYSLLVCTAFVCWTSLCAASQLRIIPLCQLLVE